MLLSKRIRTTYDDYKKAKAELSRIEYGSDYNHFLFGKVTGLRQALTSLIIDHCIDKYQYRIHDHEPLFHMLFGGES